MSRTTRIAFMICLLAACGDDGAGDDVDGGGDVIDGGAGVDGDVPDIDAGGGADANPSCTGSEELPVAQITGTEGLAIAPDGTLYYSQSGAVGRRRPGMAPEDDWATLTGVGTIFGLVMDDDGILYVAVPGGPGSTGAVWKVDTTVAPPAPEILYSPAPSANGIVIGPDGAIYYSQLGGGTAGVYRVDTTTGVRTKVNMANISGGPNGIFFQDPTTLLALGYQNGHVTVLTLDANMVESSRVDLGEVINGSPDGIARDAQGRWYIGDNGAGRLLRYASNWTGEEVLLMNIDAAANVVFGKGALNCNDVYVASGGSLGIYHGDSPGTP